MEDRPRQQVPPRADDQHDDAQLADMRRLRGIFETGLGIPFTDGNRVTVLRNGDEIFPPMLEAIRQARHTVDFLSFVYWTGDIAGRFAHALADKAREGVAVQVILDAVGAAPMQSELLELMRDAGVAVVWFRPPVRWRLWQSDNRTHRKVLVCDARVAFTGGVGIAAEWEGDARGPDEWRETHFRIEGPAVRGLQAAFIDEWAEAGEPLDSYDDERASAPDEGGPSAIQTVKTTATIEWSDVATLLQLVILHARRRLRITTPYFVPGDMLVRMLREARQRGVEVQILVPGPHTDERLVQLAGHKRYDELFEAGVDLWEYQRTMLHAKIITVDGVCSVIGSANVNQRSMSKDDELVLVVLDPAICATLDRHFEEDLRDAEGFDPEKWRERSLTKRVKERLTRVLRPQL